VQLVAFHRIGGLDAIFDISSKFTNSISEIVKVNAEERSESAKKELVHAYGGLKISLHLLHPIVSSKPLFESGQTLLVMTRDTKKETDPEYFEPHDFLVKLRLVALPLLRSLWEAPWLISAPLSVSRSVVQTVLELANGENEELKGDTESLNGETPVQGGSAPVARPTGPDEGRIRQLTDMGFPRSAAERALARTHNNVNTATELLLAHPFPLPPDPESTDPESVAEEAPADENVPVIPAAEEGIQPEPEPEPEPEPSTSTPAVADDVPTTAPATETLEPEPEPEPEPEGKTAEAWRNELNEAREPLRAGISRQALLLVDEHLSLIFDLHVAFVRPSSRHQEQAVRDLVDDIKAFSPSAYDVQEQPLANRCRLLALVLCETPSSLGQELKATLMESLLQLLSSPVDKRTIPKWLAAHLLVTEALFTLGDQPRTVTLPKEGEPIVAEDIISGPQYTEERSKVFDFCLHLLAIADLPSDELLSVLRLFVLLTRDYQRACEFVKRDGITLLFNRLRSSGVAGSQSYIVIILRHIVEDSGVLQHVIQHAIKRYFAQPRTRVVDVGTYVRNCNAMALRDPQVFVEVTKSICRLTLPYSSTPHVTLKQNEAVVAVTDDNSAPKGDEAENADMHVDATTPAASVPGDTAGLKESLESIVHFLISELMRSMKSTTESVDSGSPELLKPRDGPLALKLDVGGEPSSGIERQEEPTDTSGRDRYHYACFLMQCLTELLFSYEPCKVAFLSYSLKKRPQTPGKDSANKHRTATLQFLLSDLISFGTICPQPDAEARERIMICNWAMSVVVALCVDSSSSHELKDVSPDLVSVRKFVLEAVSRSIKDLPPPEGLDARYGRLLALADLCNRLLTVRFNATSRKQQDDTPTHLAKIMLEKNFVATLTNALSEVDLNYPNVRGVVGAILRPLELLWVISVSTQAILTSASV
jgi:E3 ubiquitin-protein ligase HUWE1